MTAFEMANERHARELRSRGRTCPVAGKRLGSWCLRPMYIGLFLVLWLTSNGAHAWWSDPDPQQPPGHLIWQGADFPGRPPEDAEPVSTTLRFALHPRDFTELRLRFPPRNRKSTGLYRAPDKPLLVTVRPVDGAAPSPGDPRLTLIVGAHETLPPGAGIPGGGARWSQAIFPLAEGQMLDKGQDVQHDWARGLISIEAGQAGVGAFDITIDGAVRAPWFKLGRDSLTQWQEVLRHEPAPWAELEGERAILTLPSAMIRDLDDPVPVICLYDRLVENANAIVGLSSRARDLRDRAPDLPVRFVLDPALDSSRAAPLATAGTLIRINAAFYGPEELLHPDSPAMAALLMHELGHNYEPVDALFEPPGASQAFAELFDYADQSRKGYSLVLDRASRTAFWVDFFYNCLPSLGYPAFFFSDWLFPDREDAGELWDPDPERARVKKRAFMNLLVRRLSPAFIGPLYSSFRHTPAEALPDSDDQQRKTDFFFELLCEVTGQDLTRLFQTWYVPVSDQAYQRVADQGYDIPPWVRHDGL